MFIGFERSTDMRCPNTKIKKFPSEKQLRRWLGLDINPERSDGHGGTYTHADPKAAMNWHHDIRYGYQVQGRLPRSKRDRGSSSYPRTENDNVYDQVTDLARSEPTRCREIR